ncbi:hypothetical protein ANN_08009 [Periplaneta americana]|uniref:HAT C-terminal dimerisation domain-containing protein n=1 Tax=Periplaneta americana TaxID=6978 RepID=A0ABQ8T1S9_PERAM|nr:hypothetical protein ANN_08009 [Periplaneta americana]
MMVKLIPDLPRKSSVAAFRLATGHDFGQHLHRIGMYQSPNCPLCNSNQEMDSEHLKICASVADHDNIFEKYWSARGQMTLPENGLNGFFCNFNFFRLHFHCHFYNSPRDLTYFKYALMTSVDVERSFSMFRNVLSENRRSFTPKNLEMTIVICCNAKFCAEHARKAQLARQKSSRRHVPPPSAESFLLSLSHYSNIESGGSKRLQQGDASNLDGKEGDALEDAQDFVTKALNPFGELDKLKQNMEKLS